MRFLPTAAASLVILMTVGCHSVALAPITVSYDIESDEPEKNLLYRVDALPDLIAISWEPAYSNQPTILIPIKDLIRASSREHSNSPVIHDNIAKIKNLDLRVTRSGSMWYHVFIIHPSIEILTQDGRTVRSSLEARDCPSITFKAYRTVNSMFSDPEDRRHWAETIQQAVVKVLVEASDSSLAIGRRQRDPASTGAKVKG